MKTKYKKILDSLEPGKKSKPVSKTGHYMDHIFPDSDKEFVLRNRGVKAMSKQEAKDSLQAFFMEAREKHTPGWDLEELYYRQ